MAPIRIPGAHNPVNQVEFELELAGEEILAFTVPKYQYIAKPVMDKYEPWYLDWQKRALAVDDESAAERETMHDTEPILALLEALLPKSVYNKIAKLTRGELMAIDTHWTKESSITLGESVASDPS